MKTSKSGVDMIAGFEGLRLQAYKPVSTEPGWTIGYGHHGPDVHEGKVITRQAARDLLVADLKTAEFHVGQFADRLNQHQFDALVSLVFNTGPGSIAKGTTIGDALRAGNTRKAADGFLLWVKGGNPPKPLAGLVRRRQIERALFLKPTGVARMSNAALRAFLTTKAVAGQFDRRMCAYYGVDTNINHHCHEAICRAYARGLVPTSTTGGTHAPGSYHYQHKAVDFGLRRELIGTAKGARMIARYQRAEWRAWKKGRRPHMVELIGPRNAMVVLNGRATTLPEGSALETQHDGHCHQAFEN